MEQSKIVGKVKRFDPAKGFGFIIGPDQEDVFVHFKFINMEGFKTLKKGQEVRYLLVRTDRGPQAHEVEPL